MFTSYWQMDNISSCLLACVTPQRGTIYATGLVAPLEKTHSTRSLVSGSFLFLNVTWILWGVSIKIINVKCNTEGRCQTISTLMQRPRSGLNGLDVKQTGSGRNLLTDRFSRYCWCRLFFLLTMTCHINWKVSVSLSKESEIRISYFIILTPKHQVRRLAGEFLPTSYFEFNLYSISCVKNCPLVLRAKNTLPFCCTKCRLCLSCTITWLIKFNSNRTVFDLPPTH